MPHPDFGEVGTIWGIGCCHVRLLSASGTRRVRPTAVEGNPRRTFLARKATPMTDNQTANTDFSFKEAGSLIGSVASDIKIAAGHKFDEALAEVRNRTDEAKAGVANDVKDVAMALRRASEELRGGSAQERTLGQISSTIADASDSIRDKDLGEILHMTSKVARANPLVFLGGAALLGFAFSRYVKASGDQAILSTAQRSADQKAQVAAFVDEGNPNTQPVQAAT